MLQAVAFALPVAVALLLAALPMVIVALLLATKRPPSVSYAFLAGWGGGLLVAGAVVVALADVTVVAGGPGVWSKALKVLAGAVLVVLGVRKWLGRRKGEGELPSWMAAVEQVTPGRALGLGFLLAAANPKNLVLVVAGATVIAEATSRIPEQLVALLVFVVVASLGVAAPTVVRAALGDRSEAVLARADAWMTLHSATIMAVVLVVLGVVLVLNGLTSEP